MRDRAVLGSRYGCASTVSDVVAVSLDVFHQAEVRGDARPGARPNVRATSTKPTWTSRSASPSFRAEIQRRAAPRGAVVTHAAEGALALLHFTKGEAGGGGDDEGSAA